MSDSYELIVKGAAEVVQEDELRAKLRKGTPLVVKLGLDPSVPDIHLGHAVVLRKARQLQLLGHRVNIIIGDFTAQIGDPSGKNKTRPQLSREETAKNASTYQQQLHKILDPTMTEVRFNSEWLDALGTAGLVELCSKYTIARILEREDFKARFEREQPLSMHELLYPLLQGYDSVALHADIELGGTEQRFNLLVGRYLQRVYGQESQVALMMPLLVGTDGKEKMSKSLGNYIGIDQPAVDVYGSVMSIPDDLIIQYYDLATDEDPVKIRELAADMQNGRIGPMEAKIDLARHITRLYHSEESAVAAECHFDRVFRRRDGAVDIEVAELRLTTTEEAGIWLPRVLKELGLVGSTSDARRHIKAGAVRLNNVRIAQENVPSLADGDVLGVGKRRIVKLKLIR